MSNRKSGYLRNSLEYNMNHTARGHALIFNHEHFDNNNVKSRSGTNVDCDILNDTLLDLDFTVKIHQDFSSENIRNTIETGEENHISYHSC